MKLYDVEIKRPALKQLKKLSNKDILKISIILKSLREEPRPAGCKKAERI